MGQRGLRGRGQTGAEGIPRSLTLGVSSSRWVSRSLQRPLLRDLTTTSRHRWVRGGTKSNHRPTSCGQGCGEPGTVTAGTCHP